MLRRLVCRHCHSPHWSDFRVFQCRHCAHQFTSDSLHTRPDHLFPVCPACRRVTDWHPGYGKNPLRWLRSKLGEAS